MAGKPGSLPGPFPLPQASSSPGSAPATSCTHSCCARRCSRSSSRSAPSAPPGTRPSSSSTPVSTRLGAGPSLCAPLCSGLPLLPQGRYKHHAQPSVSGPVPPASLCAAAQPHTPGPRTSRLPAPPRPGCLRRAWTAHPRGCAFRAVPGCGPRSTPAVLTLSLCTGLRSARSRRSLSPPRWWSWRSCLGASSPSSSRLPRSPRQQRAPTPVPSTGERLSCPRLSQATQLA